MWFWTVKGWMYEFATDLFQATTTPQIVSMSWGWPEPDQCQIPDSCKNGETSYEYVTRTNVEFMKIGQKGITLLAASGDQGLVCLLNILFFVSLFVFLFSCIFNHK
jgi:hypothetical protein